ncbi:MAG TPA: SRPBCC family protein [Chloroflexota bacterium]|nr:SRPBCC family protein [Chloroflexota bacterium]
MSIHTENRIEIAAPATVIWDIAAAVERWPEILPHYRYVRSEGTGEERIVHMGASRSGIPVRWSARQELHPERNEITYHHTAGVTQGMDVVWHIVPSGRGCTVSIDHDLTPRRWWLRPAPARYIVGTLFVMHIADRTLAGVRQEAEARAA